MNLMVYNMLWKKMFEILTSIHFPNHVPGTMPSLSFFFSYLDSPHFSEFSDILYMVVGCFITIVSSLFLYLDSFPMVMVMNEWMNEWKFWLSPGLIKNKSLINQRTHNCGLDCDTTPRLPLSWAWMLSSTTLYHTITTNEQHSTTWHQHDQDMAGCHKQGKGLREGKKETMVI